jgi:hypothetical protein
VNGYGNLAKETEKTDIAMNKDLEIILDYLREKRGFDFSGYGSSMSVFPGPKSLKRSLKPRYKNHFQLGLNVSLFLTMNRPF